MLHTCLFTCHLEVYPRDELLASLLPNRSSFDFIHLWRLLLETSSSSPTSNSGAGHQRIRRGLKAGTVCQSYTPLRPSWDGANIHQARRPEPQGPGCLDSTFPHHLLRSRRLQLYKHYLCFSVIIFRNKRYFNKAATFQFSHGHDPLSCSCTRALVVTLHGSSYRGGRYRALQAHSWIKRERDFNCSPGPCSPVHGLPTQSEGLLGFVRLFRQRCFQTNLATQ